MKQFLTISQLIEKAEVILNVCKTNVDYLSNPKKYGCGIFKCNAIVLNKERMMVVKVGENNMTDYEWAPLYPTFFTKEAAKKIVADDVFTDCEGKRIKLEIVGELEYYHILGEWAQNRIDALKKLKALTL